MRTIILGKKQLSNESWKKRINTFHLLKARKEKGHLGRGSFKFIRQYLI